MTRKELLAASARGMLFSTPMVQAILAGQKTRTMRAIKPQPMHHYREDCPANRYYDMGGNEWACAICGGEVAPITGRSKLRARHKVGDIVYVREVWQEFYACEIPNGHPRGARTELSESHDHVGEEAFFCYRADGEIFHPNDGRRCSWRPSIHMPRAAARIFLRITGVKPQRPQELTVDEIHAEGICASGLSVDCNSGTARVPWDFSRERFEALWDSLRTKKDLPLYGYEANPWCWVYEFELLEVDS